MINYCSLDCYSNVVLLLTLMTKTSEDRQKVTDSVDERHSLISNTDENEPSRNSTI